jgi:predicted Zn-dependent peptidase
VAARLLWSRLFYRFVRGDEPIAYWLRADLQARVGPSPFWVQAGISRSEESRLLRGISEEVEVLGSGHLGPEELERARSRLVDELSTREGHREQARLSAENELLFGQGAALDELANRIRKVSADDVRRVVEEYLLSTEWPVSVVGRGARRDVPGR